MLISLSPCSELMLKPPPIFHPFLELSALVFIKLIPTFGCKFAPLLELLDIPNV